MYLYFSCNAHQALIVQNYLYPKMTPTVEKYAVNSYVQ